MTREEKLAAAARYVLGDIEDAERIALEAAIPGDVELASAVDRLASEMQALDDTAGSLPVREGLWQRIASQLETVPSPAAMAAKPSLPRRAGLCRAWTALAASVVVAAGLGFLAGNFVVPTPKPVVIAVLINEGDGNAGRHHRGVRRRLRPHRAARAISPCPKAAFCRSGRCRMPTQGRSRSAPSPSREHSPRWREPAGPAAWAALRDHPRAGAGFPHRTPDRPDPRQGLRPQSAVTRKGPAGPFPMRRSAADQAPNSAPSGSTLTESFSALCRESRFDRRGNW